MTLPIFRSWSTVGRPMAVALGRQTVGQKFAAFLVDHWSTDGRGHRSTNGRAKKHRFFARPLVDRGPRPSVDQRSGKNSRDCCSTIGRPMAGALGRPAVGQKNRRNVAQPLVGRCPRPCLADDWNPPWRHIASDVSPRWLGFTDNAWTSGAAQGPASFPDNKNAAQMPCKCRFRTPKGPNKKTTQMARTTKQAEQHNCPEQAFQQKRMRHEYHILRWKPRKASHRDKSAS